MSQRGELPSEDDDFAALFLGVQVDAAGAADEGSHVPGFNVEALSAPGSEYQPPASLAEFWATEPTRATAAIKVLKRYRKELRALCLAAGQTSQSDGSSAARSGHAAEADALLRGAAVRDDTADGIPRGKSVALLRAQEVLRGTAQLLGTTSSTPAVDSPRDEGPQHVQAVKSATAVRSSFLGLHVGLQEVLAAFQAQLRAQELDGSEAAAPGDELLQQCFSLLGQLAGLQGMHPRAVRIISICAAILCHAAYRPQLVAAGESSNVPSAPTTQSKASQGRSLASYMPAHRWNACLLTSLQELKEKVERAKATNRDLQSSIGHTSNAYHIAMASTKALQREGEHLEQRRDELRAKKSAAEERLHNLTAQYSEQSQEVRSARRSAEEKEAQVAKKQLRIRQLQEALEKVNQQIERHPVGRMSNFKTADNRTKSLVMSAEKELEKLQQALHRIRTQHQAKLDAHAAMLREIDDLRNQERLAVAEYAVLKKERSVVRRTHTPRPDWDELLADIPVIPEPSKHRSHHSFVDPDFRFINGFEVPESIMRFAHKPKSTADAATQLKGLILKGRKYTQNRAADLVAARKKLAAQRIELKQAEETLARLLAQKESITGHSLGVNNSSFALEQEPDGVRTRPGEYRTVRGLGFASNVPPFLRYEGLLRVRIHRKPEVDAIVREVWRLSTRESNRETLQNVLSQYFKNRYGIQGLVVKAGYSLMYSMSNFFYDSDIELFALTLRGEMSLEVKVDQMAMLEALKEYLKKVDLMDQGIVTTLIPTAHVAQALKSFFPNKSIVRLKEIVEAMQYDSTDPDMVECDKLFDDSDTHTSRTLLILRQQHMAEIKEMVGRLQQAARVLDPTEEGTVAVSRLPGLLRSMDPRIPLYTINEYMARGLCMSTEDVTKKLYHHHGVTGDKNAGTDALTNSLVAIGAKQHRASQQAQDNDADAPKKPLLGSIATLRNSQAGLGGSQRRLLLQTSSVVSISQDKVELTERQGSEKQLGAGATQEGDGETSVWMVDLHDFISNLLTGLVKPHRNFVPSAEPQLDDFKHEEIKRAAQSEELARSFNGNTSKIRRAIGSLRTTKKGAGSVSSASLASSHRRSRRTLSDARTSMASTEGGMLSAASSRRSLGTHGSGSSSHHNVAIAAQVDAADAQTTERPHVLSILMATSSPLRRRSVQSAVVGSGDKSPAGTSPLRPRRKRRSASRSPSNPKLGNLRDRRASSPARAKRGSNVKAKPK